jgi:hypothetical protein
MKTILAFPLIAIVITGVVLTNCKTNKKSSNYEVHSTIKESKQTAEAIPEISGSQKFVNSDYEKFIEEAKARIRRNDYKYVRLISHLNFSNSRISEDELVEIEKLKLKNLKCKESLDNYIRNGKGNWREFESEFYSELSLLEDQYSEVAFNDVKK